MADAVQESVRRFNLAVGEWARKVPPEELSAWHRRIALWAWRAIDRKTPVRFGTLRRNNQIAIGTAPETSRIGLDPSGSVAQAEAESVVARIGPFQRVAIFNNVEYGQYVETGTSRQAPRGMYATTFAELATRFSRQK